MAANLRFNWIFKLTSASMLAFVGLGAAFGHKGRLEDDGVALFNKAQLYHLANNFGMFCTCFVTPASIPLKVAIGGFILANCVFVAPLYYIAIKGRNPYLSKAMPIGGVFMLAAWTALIFA